jgi:hypothetical protein
MRESSAASPAAPEEVTLRPLNENDLDAVVALDARSTGLSRRPYFERRRASALRRLEGRDPCPFSFLGLEVLE